MRKNGKKTKQTLMVVDNKEVVREALKGIQAELVADQVSMVRDYLKGAVRLKGELQKEIDRLSSQVIEIDTAISFAQDGDLSAIKKINIPARFLSEETVRLNGIDWRE